MKKLFATTLAIYLLFVGSSAQAQVIHLYGTIRDRATSAPLDSVRIRIELPDLSRVDTAFTNAAGYWSRTLSLTGITDRQQPPGSFSLGQNYPNPFPASAGSGSPDVTQLPFSIRQPGQVTIAVYNLLGQQLDAKRLFLAPGHYEVGWRPKGKAGLLIYAIDMNDQRISRKMLQLVDGNGGLGEIARVSAGSFPYQLPRNLTVPAKVVASKLGYEPDSIALELENDQQVDLCLEWLHRKALVIDLHNDVLEKVVGDGYQLGPRHNYNHSDIPRFFEGGVDAQMFVVWVDPGSYLNISYQKALQFFDAFDRQVALNVDRIAQARNADEIFQINAEQKLAGVLVVEGGHAIENDLEKLKVLYHRGMRYLTITWNNSLDWATSAEDSRSATRGLTDFGRQVIRTLDSLGVIIDVSHVGIKTIQDILATTKNPIIASHSGARALRNHYRNLYDDQIIAIANSGGVIGVVFYPYFLASGGSTNIATVIKHINHIVNLVGIDHVAIGSDYDGIGSTPIGLEDVSKLPALTMALLRAGYSNADVKKILGENFLRVFRQVCR